MARDPNHPEEEESTNPHGLQTASSVGSAQPRPAILKAHKRIFKPTTGKNSVPRSSSWEYTALYKRVEGNYTRSMGFGSSTGISDPFQLKPTYWDTPPTFPPATTTAINPDKENRGNASMWGYPGGSKPTGRFYEQRVSSAQKRWGLATNNKFKSPQSVCGKAAFQNGRHSDHEGHYSPKRLHGQTGLKGCLLFRASGGRRQEVSQVRVGRQSVRVHMPSVWPHKCNLDIHKAVQTSSSIFYDNGESAV